MPFVTMAYLVWAPDFEEGPSESEEIQAASPELAAETYVEKNHARFDYPSFVHVRVDRSKIYPTRESHEFMVSVKSVPTFHAKPWEK